MKIERSLVLWIGIVLVVSLFSGVEAGSSSTTWVNFNINPYNASGNNTFNGYVVGLKVNDRDKESIVWIWGNSDDGNFSYNLVFLDNILVMNGTDEIFEAVDLSSKDDSGDPDEDECYKISVVGIGVDGSEGPVVSDVACTLDGGRKVSKGGGEDDVIPNFFVGDDVDVVEDVVIRLGGSPSPKEDGFDWFVLSWVVLGFLSFVMLILISVLLIR